MSWTPRVSIASLNTYDSHATLAGGTFTARLDLGPSCASGAIHQMDLAALAGAGATLQQEFGNSSGAGSFATWTIAFPGPNTAGHALVADITFTTGSYTAGTITVTDSAGNVWTEVIGGNPAFQGIFLQTWTVTNCAAGANTLTITAPGGNPFLTIDVAIHEYGSCPGTTLAASYATGGLFGTGTPVVANVTTVVRTLLHLAVAGTLCTGTTLTGGAVAPAWVGWLVIDEPVT